MSATEIADADIVHDDAPTQPGTDLVATEAGAAAYGQTQIIAAAKPAEVMVKATEIANALRDLIERKNLAADMGGGRKHVEVGAWQAMGVMLGALGGVSLHAETVWARVARDATDGEPIRRTYTAVVKRFHAKSRGGGLREEATYEIDGYDWEACVEIRTPSGVVVGRAEGMCSRSEWTWAQRDEYALRGMAETRAEGRAWRRAAGWIVHMAGYSPTPKEEMPPEAEVVELPVWAQEAPVSVMESFGRAVGYLLGDRPDGPRVRAVLDAIAKDADGDPVPRIAARALLHLAVAHRAMAQPAQEEPPVDGPPAEPAADALPAGSVPMPLGADDPGVNPVVRIRSMRDAGCTCSDPLNTPDDTCPLTGHGIPF